MPEQIYRLNKDQLFKVIEGAPRDQEWVLDTETTGLRVIGHEAPCRAEWIGLSPLGQAVVFVISRDEYDGWGLQDLFKRLRLIGHNLRFDLHALDLVPSGEWRDTMNAPYWQNMAGRKSMDHLAEVNGWANIPTPAELKREGGIFDVDEGLLHRYLANDCIITSKMALKFNLGACSRDWALERAVYLTERRGVRLLEDKFGEVLRELRNLIEGAHNTLDTLGFDGNPGSPAQVLAWFHANGKRPKWKGKDSTNARALLPLAEEGDKEAAAITTYRKAVKLQSSFGTPLPKMLQEGILYPSIRTTKTRTSRYAYAEPPLQQIPKRGPLGKAMRYCFTSPDSSGVNGCDYSQVELRVAAAKSGEETLLEAFHAGRCPHTEVAAKMVGKRPDQVTPDERFRAKAVNFGILNGMAAIGLSYELRSTKAEAAKFLRDYNRATPRLHEWREGVWRRAEMAHSAVTCAGRRRVFRSNESTRPAISVEVQGDAGEIIRLAHVAVEEAGLRPILVVHDEILTCNGSKVNAEDLKAVMEYAANNAFPEVFGSVNFAAETGYGETWGDV